MSQIRVTVIPPRVNLQLVPFSTEYVKKRVAAYARVSTDTEEQLSSYEAQVDHYTRHIQANDEWEFVKVYTDVDMPYGLNPKALNYRLFQCFTGFLFSVHGFNATLVSKEAARCYAGRL